MTNLKDLPPPTLKQIEEMEKSWEEVRKRSEQGYKWFEKFFDELQKFPAGSLVSFNIETGEYYTVPRGWEETEELQKKRPRPSGPWYWTCRLTEGRDGKKYAGGIYSVGAVQTHVPSPDNLRRPISGSR